MKLGAFSMSLSVADLAASMRFYETLGFRHFAGEPEDGWAMMRNGSCTIGLFRDMFDGNMLTFNPGWTAEAQADPEFTDIRVIQDRLTAAGLTVEAPTDPEGRGPACITLRDPDGNTIFLDQHVGAPERD